MVKETLKEKEARYSPLTPMEKYRSPVHKKELDVLNLFFCIAVVLIHLCSEPLSALADSSLHFLVYIPWRLGMIAIPGFVFLSAVKFAVSYRETFKYPRYIWGRIKKIVLPYAAANTVYYVYFYLRGYFDADAGDFLLSFVTGNLSAQLYFIPVIMQFYLLAPLIRAALQKFGDAPCITVALMINLFWSIWMPFLLESAGADTVLVSRLFPHYLFFFTAGCAVGDHYEAFRSFAMRHRFTAIGLLIAAPIYVLLYYVAPSGIQLPAVHILCSGALIYAAYAFSAILEKAAFRLVYTKAFADLSGASFYVFLSHCLFINVFSSLWNLLGITGTGVRFFLSVLAVYITSFDTSLVMLHLQRKLAGQKGTKPPHAPDFLKEEVNNGKISEENSEISV